MLLKIRFSDYDPRGINCAVTREEENGKRDTSLSNQHACGFADESSENRERGEKHDLLLPSGDDS